MSMIKIKTQPAQNCPLIPHDSVTLQDCTLKFSWMSNEQLWMAFVINGPVSSQKRDVYIGTIGWPLPLRKLKKKWDLGLKPCKDNDALHGHRLELNTLKSDKRPKRVDFLSQRLCTISHSKFSITTFYVLTSFSICLWWRWTEDPSTPSFPFPSL